MYNVGWPGARWLGRLGVPLEVRVFVTYDQEAKVFVGTSPDVKGLVVEAESWDEIRKEALDLVPMMMSLGEKNSNYVAPARLSLIDSLPSCA